MGSYMTVVTATSRASYAGGVDCVTTEGIPRPSKGQREPPPRESKLTWKETLEQEKAAKKKESYIAN
ncbi:hypothetical protein ColTof4_03917 [Colletotrichum tofieldiae]|nr:hypothetical protein ColTof4_03917 [Colletotrichum tofieldiae]